MPNTTDTQIWVSAIQKIMAEHPEFTEEQANVGLIWAINDAAIQAGEPAPIPVNQSGLPIAPAEDLPAGTPGAPQSTLDERVTNLEHTMNELITLVGTLLPKT